jgi:hypothetical protein
VKKAAWKRTPSYPSPVSRQYLKFVAKWGVVFREKRQTYFKEAIDKIGSRLKEENVRLRKEFENRGVDFKKDIYPLFKETCLPFFNRWAARKVITETGSEARKEVKQYQFAVQIITKEASPFKAETKAELKRQLAPFQQVDLEVMFLQTLRREEGEDKHILSLSLEKEFHKHPGWKTFEKQVYQRLKEKRVTDWQAHKLIALLYETLLPDAFAAAYKADAIRLRLTSLKK